MVLHQQYGWQINLVNDEGEWNMSDDKQISKIVEKAVIATIENISNQSLIDQMEKKKNDSFKNTEKLLYNYKILKEHVQDEEGYFGMLNKGKSKSVVVYSSKSGSSNLDEDEAMIKRKESLRRSQNDLKRIEKALDAVRDRKEFKVIELRYFSRNDEHEAYSWEEITEQLKISDKTARRWKNNIVREISIRIFGSDAI